MVVRVAKLEILYLDIFCILFYIYAPLFFLQHKLRPNCLECSFLIHPYGSHLYLYIRGRVAVYNLFTYLISCASCYPHQVCGLRLIILPSTYSAPSTTISRRSCHQSKLGGAPQLEGVAAVPGIWCMCILSTLPSCIHCGVACFSSALRIMKIGHHKIR